MPNGGDRRVFWYVVLAVVALDQVTKAIATATLTAFPLPVLGDWVTFQLVHNPGAAFGINVGRHSRWVFAALALVALAVLGVLVRHTGPGQRLRLGALGLVCGGAVGNLIDRLVNARGVVDFIDVGVGSLRWPTFNVADIAVAGGAVTLAVLLLGDGHDADEKSAADGAIGPPR